MYRKVDLTLQYSRTYIYLFYLIFGLAFYNNANASCSAEPDYNTELIISLELDQFLLSDEIIAYQNSHGTLLYPLVDILTALEIDVYVENNVVTGDIFSVQNKLLINPATQEATFQKKKILDQSYQQLTQYQQLACYLDTVYVSPSVLKVFLPADFKYESNSLKTIVITHRLFPIQIAQKKEELKEKQQWMGGSQNKQLDQRYNDTAFSWNIASLSAELDSDLNSSSLSLETGGRFLYHDISLFSSTNIDGKDVSLNLVGSRQVINPKHTPFLSHYNFGDTSVSSTQGVSDNHVGIGLSLTNQPFNFISERDIDLTGTIPKNWFVELYINDILIDFSEPNDHNRFLFEKVSLFPGRNIVKYVFYGPQGQIESKTKEYFFDDMSFNKEKLFYQFDYVKTGRRLEHIFLDEKGSQNNHSMLHSNLSYGITDSLSFKLDTWHKIKEKQNNSSTINSTILRPGIKSRYSNWIQLEYYMPFYEKKNQRYASQLKVNLYPFDSFHLWADSDFYYNGYTSLDNSEPLSYQYKVGARYYLSSIRTNISGGVESTRSAATNNVSLNSSLSINTSFHHVNTALSLGQSKNSYQTSYDGSFALSYMQKYLVHQASVSGSINNERSGVNNISYSNRLPFLGNWVNLFSTDYSIENNNYEVSNSLLYTNKYFSLGIQASYQDDEGASGGLSFSTSMIKNNDSFNFTNRANPNESLADVAVKIIKADGSEDFIRNGIIKVGMRAEKLTGSKNSITNKNGAIISGIEPYEWITIELDESSLEDSSWMIKTKPISVMIEPGGMEEIIFTVIETGEIDGLILAESTRRPRKGVKILLVNKEGIVVKETVSAFDGFYLFDKVESGEYVVKISPDYLARKGLKDKPKPMTLDGDNMFILDNNFILSPKVTQEP